TALRPRRILDQKKNEEQGQDADRQINKKDPAPAVVVGDPTAQGRADGGRDHRCDAKDRKRQAALLRWKRIGQDGLRHGLQSASGGALQGTKQNDRGKAGSNSAQQGTYREEHKTNDKEALAAQEAGKPSAERQHDGV